MRHVSKRLLESLFLLFGVSILTFLFSTLAPGTYLDEMRLNPQISAETFTSLRAQYQLDQPLPVRYARWLQSIAHGDFGYSFAYSSPVGPILWVRARNTLALTVVATIVVWIIALPLGIWSAERAGRLSDRAVSLATASLLVIPELALALCLLILAVRTGWLPFGGLVSTGFDDLPPLRKITDLAAHMALPVAALVLSSLPILVRHIRAAMAEALDAPFLRVAAAHGIPRRRLVYGYALRAAANPLASLVGFSIGTLLSGSLLVDLVIQSHRLKGRRLRVGKRLFGVHPKEIGQLN